MSDDFGGLRCQFVAPNWQGSATSVPGGYTRRVPRAPRSSSAPKPRTTGAHLGTEVDQ